MIKLSGLLLILILLFGKAYGQSAIIIGKLIDSNTKVPLQNANVNVFNNTKSIYHTVSDSTGTFKIPLSLINQINHITVSYLNYTHVHIVIPYEKYSNNKGDIDLGIFKLSLQTIELKEVAVRATKRYSDTSRIDLSKKNFDRSLMIDDFFSKESGFSKNDKGQIYYKGKLVTDIVVNGGNFFGKNNTDIYQLLPAMVLSGIEVIETNIDTVTNTTLSVPRVKINLKLKDKFLKGAFGNVNLGLGTASRYLANTGLYKYEKNEQLALNINSNNINTGDNTTMHPKIDFSPNGNNITTNNVSFNYRNLYANKLEFSFSVKVKADNRNFTSEADQQEEGEEIFSKSFNSSNTKSFSIENTNFNINYIIDPLNTLTITQTYNHLHTREADSLNYIIKLDSLPSYSRLNKVHSSINNLYSTDINYQKKSASKKGRAFNINLKINDNIFGVNETNNVSGILNQTANSYFINGDRHANQYDYKISLNYTEPLSDSSYINFFAIYERNKLTYNANIKSDTTLSASDLPSQIGNNYLKPGFKFEQLFDKLTFDATVTGLIDIRNLQQNSRQTTASFYNTGAELNFNYIISKKKSLTFNFTSVTNYPSLDQLTNLNSSFELISQTEGNIFLDPEQKKSLKLDYSVKPSATETIILSGGFDHYSSTFGYSINNDVTSLQSTTTNNIGNSNNGQVSFTLIKNITPDKTLNYTNTVSYQEAPAIINGKFLLNNGITITQYVSTSLDIFKSLFSITPIITSNYGKYFYQSNTINILTFSYYDKLSLHSKGYQLNLYPLYTFNHSISNNHSFSMNGELSKSFLKNYGSVWVQAYDIFNSFKFYNNNVGSYYYQTVKYSNVERYIILGISFKFNNIR